MTKPVTVGDWVDVQCRDDTAIVDLYYPPRDEEDSKRIRYIEIDMLDVRATDGFRTWYDFERDGWVIEQASTFGWDSGDDECDPDWKEVFFVRSWARIDESQTTDQWITDLEE